MSFSRRDFVAAVAAAGMAGSVGAAAEPACAAKPACAAVCPKAAVYVVATITVKAGKRDEFVEIFKGNVPNVLAEEGCVFYDPVVDFESGVNGQQPVRPDIMVVVEKWASLDHLKKHLTAPHMATYREKVKDLVGGVDLQILQSV